MVRIPHELRRTLDLLWLLTRNEVTLKYKRTILGIFWSLLNPILLTLVLYFAFKIIMRFDMPNYTFFLLSALFPWTWFSSSVIVSAGVLVASVQLIKKVRFPRHILIASTVLGHMVNFILSMPILVVFSLVYGDGPGLIWLVGIPLLAIAQLGVTVGIALVVSALNAYFRDLEYLVGVAINMLFWVTPIIYPMERVPAKYHLLISVNPLSGVIEAWRRLFMSNKISWPETGLLLAGSAIILSVGMLVFRRLGRRIDEVI